MISTARARARLLSGLPVQTGRPVHQIFSPGLLDLRIARILFEARGNASPGQKFLWTTAFLAGLLFSIVASLRVHSILPFGGFILACGASLSLVDRYSKNRQRREFDADFPSFLMALQSSVRSGLDPVSAFYTAGRLFPSRSVLRREVEEVRARLECGEGEEESFAQFGIELAHPDIPLLLTALSLARKQGGSLGGALERLSSVARQRQSFRRKTRAAVALQRISSVAIACIALSILCIQLVVNATARELLISSTVGRAMVAVGFALLVLGIAWMFRLSRIKV